MSFEQKFQEHADHLPWAEINDRLRDDGVAAVPGIFSADECQALQKLSGDRGLFHKFVTMEDKGYGKGEYGYFTAPPAEVSILRKAFYEATVPLANAWLEAAKKEGKNSFGIDRYPDKYEDFAVYCAANGQGRNACLLLSYPDGGYNELHQDKYGVKEISYPFQLVVQLTRQGEDFTGGAFQLSENGQVRGFNPAQGDGVIFPSVHRVAAGRVLDVKHGVAPLRGMRKTLGIVAHGHDNK